MTRATLRQGFGWRATPRRAKHDTPRPVSTHATRRAGPGGGGHWCVPVAGKVPLCWRGVAKRRGGKRVSNYPLSLLTCHSRLIHPTNIFMFAGAPGAGIGLGLF